MQIDPAEARNLQKRRGNEKAVGDHRRRLGRELLDRAPDVFVLFEARRRVNGDSSGVCLFVHGRPDEFAASPSRGGGASEDGEDVVSGVEEALQRRHRGLRRSGEENSHPFSVGDAKGDGFDNMSPRPLATEQQAAASALEKASARCEAPSAFAVCPRSVDQTSGSTSRRRDGPSCLAVYSRCAALACAAREDPKACAHRT